MKRQYLSAAYSAVALAALVSGCAHEQDVDNGKSYQPKYGTSRLGVGINIFDSSLRYLSVEDIEQMRREEEAQRQQQEAQWQQQWEERARWREIEAEKYAKVKEAQTTEKVAKFAIEFYKHVADGNKGNLVVSPYGAESVLALMATGALGQTADEFAAVLSSDATDPDRLAASFAALRDWLELEDGLEISDSLWLEKAFCPREDFTSRVRTTLGAEVRSLGLDEMREAINSYVYKATHGKIGMVIQDDLPEKTKLIAVNTVYFLGKWSTPFHAVFTRDRTFHAPDGDVKAPFLSSTRNANLAETETCAALSLPYGRGNYEMMLVLPVEGVPLEAIEKALSPRMLDELTQKQAFKEVEILFPKFEFESRHDFLPIFSKVGLGSAVSCQDANFGGIADLRPDERLYVSQMRQVARIKTDEEGTEAVAATFASGIRASGGYTIRPKTFVADRPFLFVIRNRESGFILFMGRVTNPKGN